MKTLHLTAEFKISRAEKTIAYWYGGSPVNSYGQYLRSFCKGPIGLQEFLYARFILAEFKDIIKLMGASEKPEAPRLVFDIMIKGIE